MIGLAKIKLIITLFFSPLILFSRSFFISSSLFSLEIKL